jgi:hypothetical protein
MTRLQFINNFSYASIERLPPKYSTTIPEPPVPEPPVPEPPAPEPPVTEPPIATNTTEEIFKSFRISMEDPVYKVLPAALRKYKINAPWESYALYIVYGDNERCLGMDEKPLVIVKMLGTEGKNPMFMLRKICPSPAKHIEALGAPFKPPGGIL